jgi:hypothetical protein
VEFRGKQNKAKWNKTTKVMKVKGELLGRYKGKRRGNKKA